MLTHYNYSPKISFMKQLISIMLSILCFTSISCSNVKKAGNSNSDKKFTVTATFYPLYIMLMNITQGSDTEIKMLAPGNTGCLHDYELSAKDMKILSASSVIVLNGLGMENFIDKIINIQGAEKIIAGEGFSIIENNPHIWVSPQGAVYQVKKIAEELSRIDSRNSELYQKNAAEYSDRILQVESLIQQELAQKDLSNVKCITFHEAFTYFAHQFNIKLLASIEKEPGESPSAKQMSELVKTVKNEINSGSKILLFGEPQYPETSAQIIARETGIKLYHLDPGVTGSLEKDAYLLAMKISKY